MPLTLPLFGAIAAIESGRTARMRIARRLEVEKYTILVVGSSSIGKSTIVRKWIRKSSVLFFLLLLLLLLIFLN